MQLEGYSIDAQKEFLLSYAKSKEFTEYEYYVDGGYSGKDLNRPEIQRLIQDVKEHKIDTVIVFKLDRISRSQKDTLYLIEEVFNKYGVGFISIKENFDTTSPFGKAMIGVLSVFAQLERETILERTRIGIKKRAEDGYWRGGGKIPFPYKYDMEQGILIPIPEQVEILNKMISMYLSGKSFNNIGEEFKGNVRLHIPGLYNIYNALGVIGVLVVGGYVIVEDVIEGFDTMKAVAGRCERVYHDKMNCTVVVDYAHTPDGLENILETMKEVVKGKLITVFGCGGDRDKTKRPQMGSIAERYSDVTIVTSDNPRTEDPHSIIEDILEGIKDSHTVIEDRKDAIEYACRIAGENDIVVIAGKGHEDYQIIGTVKHHFSDKEVVLNYFDSI